MKKILLCGIALLLIMSGMARAALITIGTATYDDGSGSAEYKLIFDNDNNGNSVVWLDYTNSGDWADMMDWAAGLGNDLTINLDDGYSVTWEEDAWRLPATEPGSPVWGQGYIGYGVTSSEMGHLYYVELGNPAGGPMTNLGDFENLDAVGWYDSGTEYDADSVWCFYMATGMQQLGERVASGDWEDPALGMALINAKVSAVFPLGTHLFMWTNPPTWSSFIMIEQLGDAVKSITQVNEASGKCESAYLLWGKKAGNNFCIQPQQSYRISITSPCSLSF